MIKKNISFLIAILFISSCSTSSSKIKVINKEVISWKIMENYLDQVKRDKTLSAAHFFTSNSPLTLNDQLVVKGLKDYFISSEKKNTTDLILHSVFNAETDYQKSFSDYFTKNQLLIFSNPIISKNILKYDKKIPANKGFIVVDHLVKHKNVNSILFNVLEAAFYAGYAAGSHLSKNQTDFSKDGYKVGVYGEKNNRNILSYMSGFQQGLAYWNEMNDVNEIDPEFIELGIKKEDYFISKNQTGAQLTQKLLDKGADIIMIASIKNLTDSLKIIKNNGKKTLVVGIENNQIKQYYKYKDLFLTSVVKRKDLAVEKAIKYIYKQKHNTKDFLGFGLGIVTVGQLKNELTELATNDFNQLNAFDPLKWQGIKNLREKALELKNKFIIRTK